MRSRSRSNKKRVSKSKSKSDSKFKPHLKKGKATTQMSLTDLQKLAKYRGIQFGRLDKVSLIEKINEYY